MTRSENLQKAAWLTDLFSELGIPLEEDASAQHLANLWDQMVAWLSTNKEWQRAAGVKEHPKGWSFHSMMTWMQSQPGGKFLNFRVLRAQERLVQSSKQEGDVSFLAVRYVVSDGSREFAEIVVDDETAEIQWVMVYSAQNLVHLVKGLTQHGIRIVD